MRAETKAIAARTPWRWPAPYRAVVVVVAVAVVAATARTTLASQPVSLAFVSLLVMLARAVPVVYSRDRPITFVAAVVYAASLIVGGPAAGACALSVHVLWAALSDRGARARIVFLGAQYTLAAAVSGGVFMALIGDNALRESASASLAAKVAAAAAFIAVNSLLVALDAAGTRHISRARMNSVLRVHAMAYAASFPLALLVAVAYRSLGHAAIPSLAGVLLIAAYAVRLTVENRLLALHARAVEALGQSCAHEVRPEEPLRRFLALTRDLVTFERAVLWTSDDVGGRLRPRAWHPGDAAVDDVGDTDPDGLLAESLARSKPLVVPDLRRDPRYRGTARAESWVLCPLHLHGRPLGVAQFIRAASRPFSRAESLRLHALAPQVSVAFESARIRHLMLRYANLATTDGLTGLMNHRRCQETLSEEVQRAVRYGRPLAVLMLDLDAFKQFNDTFGHPQGDALLRRVAQILRGSLRTSDHIARYGGEEFMVILPETTRDEAWHLAERVRRNVGGASIEVEDGRIVYRTVSIGVAGYPDDGAAPADLVQKADAALYRAKRSGRNRVHSA
ncbi:MAG TPA: sensor domain-containing diguanylate cyclase [Chthonomonadales bacterium]|nr:sensor domain-containing diguanylate cyclase [Chthonomonadales bacterium]